MPMEPVLPLTLPKSIADYFAADAGDGVAVARCMTADAVVVDEGRTYRGRDAVVSWKSAAAAKYDYASEPIAVAEDGGRTIVTARVTGNFPGSPIDLRYGFTLEGDAIAKLEIAL